MFFTLNKLLLCFIQMLLSRFDINQHFVHVEFMFMTDILLALSFVIQKFI